MKQSSKKECLNIFTYPKWVDLGRKNYETWTNKDLHKWVEKESSGKTGVKDFLSL